MFYELQSEQLLNKAADFAFVAQPMEIENILDKKANSSFTLEKSSKKMFICNDSDMEPFSVQDETLSVEVLRFVVKKKCA